MQLRLLVFLLTLISFASTALSQDCCTADIVKLEKKLSRKYESYKRILSLPKDGEVNRLVNNNVPLGPIHWTHQSG